MSITADSDGFPSALLNCRRRNAQRLRRRLEFACDQIGRAACQNRRESIRQHAVIVKPLVGPQGELRGARGAREKERKRGKINYSFDRWSELTHFVDDGDVPISNNWVENHFRPIALGRSNWLFAGSFRAGQTSGGHHEPAAHRTHQWA